MLLETNVTAASKAIDPHFDLAEKALDALHTALNIITPDASFDYDYTKWGNSADLQATIKAVFTFKFDTDPNQHTITIKFDTHSITLRATILIDEDELEFYVASSQQVIELAKYIHKNIVQPNNTFNQTISINELTNYQKLMIDDFIRMHNLQNL